MKRLTLIAASIISFSISGCGVVNENTAIKSPTAAALSVPVNTSSSSTVEFVRKYEDEQQKAKMQEAGAQGAGHTVLQNASSNKPHLLTENYWDNEPPLQEDGKNVVLTFDDGPSPWTGNLVQTLDREQVPAVMFWNTYHLSYANQNNVKGLLQSSPNITVGDHTVDHPDMNTLGYDAQYKEIVNARQTIEGELGRPVVYYRPPFGSYNATTEKVLKEQHMTAVMWNDDSLDWKYNSNEHAILNEIKSELHPGAIILMHDHMYTVKYLPDIIRMIRAEGYGFTTFSSPLPPTESNTTQNQDNTGIPTGKTVDTKTTGQS